MAEQRVNAAGQTVEFNEYSQRWEPVKEDVKSEEKEQDDTEEFDVEVDEKPVSTFTYTPPKDNK